MWRPWARIRLRHRCVGDTSLKGGLNSGGIRPIGFLDGLMTETAARPQNRRAVRLLPPFPAIAHRILALASRDDVNINELGDLVKMDPSFSAELLRFANSALFGARREVTSL